jgi:hypothetical protein
MNSKDYSDLEDLLIRQHDETNSGIEQLFLNAGATQKVLVEINTKLQWLLYVGYVLVGILIAINFKLD